MGPDERSTVALATYRSIEDLEAAIGVETGPGEWLEVTQERVNGFADATDDHQWIHLDVERAKDGPFGTTIAHGFLTLSLLPYFGNELRELQNVRMAVNYGLNKVRFPAPVPVGSRLRATSSVLSVKRLDAASAQVVTQISVAIDGAGKPACVAETVARIYFED
ncbi:MaoC family dehydratase [uncultured Jatrophihabitans sp.]|uniref:MaoC family dehydratase n=1 Tax=uncultured Jatrophihabitans sp. TaxID=1610747 RepID=UPI0035C96CA7